MKKIILIIGLCSCSTTQSIYEDSYRYYVMDVNGTEPDAVFENKSEATIYVEKFKEFHEYRIVKAQPSHHYND